MPILAYDKSSHLVILLPCKISIHGRLDFEETNVQSMKIQTKNQIQNTSINQTLKINEIKNFHNQIINQPINYKALNQANLYSNKL